jgi:hypothetical protein
MYSKKFFTILFLTFPSVVFSQKKPALIQSPLDTINGLIIGSYPEIHASKLKGLPDSLLIPYPNRNNVDFTNLTSSQRDSTVQLIWKKLNQDFNKSISSNSIKINRKTKFFFFTLYFDPDGKLRYLFYNWNKFPDNNSQFNERFILFVSQYDFSGFPQGKAWSQCGTFTYKGRF